MLMKMKVGIRVSFIFFFNTNSTLYTFIILAFIVKHNICF